MSISLHCSIRVFLLVRSFNDRAKIKTYLSRRKWYGGFPSVYRNVEVADATADTGCTRIGTSTEWHSKMRRSQRMRFRDVALAKILVLSFHLSEPQFRN